MERLEFYTCQFQVDDDCTRRSTIYLPSTQVGTLNFVGELRDYIIDCYEANYPLEDQLLVSVRAGDNNPTRCFICAFATGSVSEMDSERFEDELIPYGDGYCHAFLDIRVDSIQLLLLEAIEYKMYKKISHKLRISFDA